MFCPLFTAETNNKELLISAYDIKRTKISQLPTYQKLHLELNELQAHAK